MLFVILQSSLSRSVVKFLNKKNKKNMREDWLQIQNIKSINELVLCTGMVGKIFSNWKSSDLIVFMFTPAFNIGYVYLTYFELIFLRNDCKPVESLLL